MVKSNPCLSAVAFIVGQSVKTLPAEMIERCRIKFLTQRHFRAKFAAFFCCILWAFAWVKVSYTNTTYTCNLHRQSFTNWSVCTILQHQTISTLLQISHNKTCVWQRRRLQQRATNARRLVFKNCYNVYTINSLTKICPLARKLTKLDETNNSDNYWRQHVHV